MNYRWTRVIRSALVAIPALAVAGAAPTSQRQYHLHCKLTRHGGTELASPAIDVVETQTGRFVVGGTAPTARAGVSLDYGISLTASVAPAADGKLLLDVAVSATSFDTTSAAGVTVGGYTVHTVCTALPAKPVHVAAGDVACEVTATPISP